MKIYVGHSTSFDFDKELYQPILNSELSEKHEFILPHASKSEGVNSKNLIAGCDLFLAEVSRTSTGLGIELGWADAVSIPIKFLHKSGATVSGTLKFLSSEFIEYRNEEDLAETLAQHI